MLADGLFPGSSVAAQATMLFAYAALAVVSVVLAVIDLRRQRLPNAIVLPSIAGFALCAVCAALIGGGSWGESLQRALAAGVVLTLMYLVLWWCWAGGIGLGDVKLSLLLGLALGWMGWGALLVGGFAAFLLGGAWGALLVATGRSGRGKRIPFGPWILLGAWIGIVVGEPIAGWLLG